MDEERTIVQPTDLFFSAAQIASASPEQDQAWDTLDRIARATQQADQVAELYRSVIRKPLPEALLVKLAERALRFHDEWLDDVDAVIAILSRALEVDPTLPWAFDRISLHLTVLARWDELLAFYDRAIEAVEDPERRVSLLEEAAHLAKDCAGQIDRALGYLGKLFSLSPSDKQVAGSLERLLKQHKRFRELIEFWTTRLQVLSPAEALAVRGQIASCWLRDLNDPDSALSVLEPLLVDPASAESACLLLEEIVGSSSFQPSARRDALRLLRQRYEETQRGPDIVRVLRGALQFADDSEKIDIHRQIAGILVAGNQTAEAVNHLAALLVLDADSWDDIKLGRVLKGEFPDKVAGCSPRLNRDEGRDLVHRAAEIAANELNAPDRATLLYRRLLQDAPSDVRAIEALAALCEKRGQARDLLELRRYELKLATDVTRRLALRLELARLLGEMGEEDERIQALQQNMEEQPDHEPSIRALIAVLEGSERSQELAALLCVQAERVEKLQSPSLAAELWNRAAKVVENRLNDLPKAVSCYERVVALSPTLEALDALARIHVQLSNHAQAVYWLDQALELAVPGRRTDTMIRLVRAHVSAGQHDRALVRLQQGLAEDPSSLEMRQLEAELHRSSGNWEALAVALEQAARWAKDAMQLAILREAAEVYQRRLRAPERAIPILEQATALAPDDRAMRIALADSLRAAGRLADARTMAEQLVEEFGRHRPPERTGLHVLLGEILDAQGDSAEAIHQLEFASSIDMGHLGVQGMLADLYRKTGQLQRAERAYHALLLILRRARSKAAASDPDKPSIAATLFNLHRVALQLGNEQRAAENLESAFDAASRDERESLGLERILRESGETDTYLRALDLRLKRTEEAAARCDILTEMASTLDRMGRPSEALDRWLDALADQPHSADLHDRAHDLANRVGLVHRYAELLDGLSGKALEARDTALACDLLLRLGCVQEQDEGASDRAVETYARAETTGERRVQVWQSLARAYGALGDATRQRDVLRRLVDSHGEELAPEYRVDALFSLADLELASGNVSAGLVTIERAIRCAPEYFRAAASLCKAFEIDPTHDGALELYERVARASADRSLLLDALCRLSAAGRITQGLLQEAATLAAHLHADDQRLTLLNRAVEVASDAGARTSALWAMRALADYAVDSGAIASAIEWMNYAAEVASADEARELRFRVAELAVGPAGDLELAAQTYERLLEQGGDTTPIWRPLLDVVRKLGDRDRLERLLGEAAEAEGDLDVRILLRLERAQLLVSSNTRANEAIPVLRRILQEHPDHMEAATMLCDLLARTGDREELAALLTRQLDSARSSNDAESGVAIGLRLGALLAPSRREDAIAVYRSVLEWIPDQFAVLRALLAVLQDEAEAADRADILERLLQQESGEPAVNVALELAKMRETLGDVDGIERALLHAHAVDSHHAEARQELGRFADTLERHASEQPDGGLRWLLKAAALYRNQLRNTASAASALSKAHALRPADRELLEELATCMVDSGQPRGAVAAVTDTINACSDESSEFVELLRLRAQLWAACDENDEAVVDLERALTLAGDSVLPELYQALHRAKGTAASRFDFSAERRATLRLAEVLGRMGDSAQERAVLAEWVGTSPEDREALEALITTDLSAERWDDVAEGYARLLDLEEGDKQVEVVLLLADACEKANRPQDAKEGLEKVYELSPDNPAVRARLRRLYETIGAHRELANVLIVETKHSTDDNHNFELLKEAGRLRLHELREPTMAIGPLSDAVSLRNTDHEATVLLADAYTVAGLVDEAAQLLDTAISRHGGKRSKELASLQHRMARVAALGDRENELSWLYAAFDSNPQSGEIASELADLAIELGHFEVALKALRAITSMKSPGPMSRPMAYLKQAKIAYQQGDERRAVFFAKKAQAEDADFPEAREFLLSLGQAGG